MLFLASLNGMYLHSLIPQNIQNRRGFLPGKLFENLIDDCLEMHSDLSVTPAVLYS